MTAGASNNKYIHSGRRRFLKLGLAGSALLAAAAGGLVLSRRPETCHPCQWIHQGDRQLLRALVPVMLAGALPSGRSGAQAIDEIITGVDVTVAHFPPTVRAEIRQLLWLLESPLTRPLLAGIWSPWSEAGVDAIQAFLNSWKHSRLDLKRVGYAALHDLVVGAWYANPLSWPRIGYPGPPALA
jgi:hypothetical protein